MTIPELIDSVLGAIMHQFYQDRFREFKRDERALKKAVCRYGYECAQRGWDFSIQDILRDLLDLMNQIKRTGAEIKYLPTYLEGAVTRHVGQRAEELQAKARSNRVNVTKVVAGVQLAKVVVQPDNTQILSAVYSDLKLISSARRKGKKKKVATPPAPAPEPAREMQGVLI